MEAATKKDQDGVRKRVAHMLGDQSPLKQMLQMEAVELKHFYKFNLRNIKDAARLYNYMHVRGGFLGEEEFDAYISRNLLANREDLIDYLHLWSPFDQVYGLPEQLFERYRDVHAVDFYPKQFKDVGPEKMKEVARDFKVFESGLIMETMQNPKSVGRLCRLIENFESFIARFECDYTDTPYILKLPLDNSDYSDDVTSRDMNWFLEMWNSSWKAGITLRSTIFYEGRIEELERLWVTKSGEKREDVENLENGKVKVILLEEGQALEMSDLGTKLRLKYGKQKVTILRNDTDPEKTLKCEDEHLSVPTEFKPTEKYFVYPYVKFIESGSYYQFRWPVANLKRIKNLDNKEESKNELDNWIWKED